MIYGGTLISVSDMERSKNFYEKVMEQTVEMDLGVHVSFQNGLSLQSNYEDLVGMKLEPQESKNIPGASVLCGFTIMTTIS